MNQVVVLVKHFTDKGNTNGKDWVRHDFKDGGGNKFQTFDANLARIAEGLLNQPAEIEYHVERRNGYENNFIDSIKAAPGSVVVPPQEEENPRQKYQRSKEEVRRTEAVKAAATIISGPNWSGDSTLEELASLADAITDLIVNGSPVAL